MGAFEIAVSSTQELSCNIFVGLSSEKYTAVRRRMVAGILSTDMKHHGHHVEAMQTFEPKVGMHSQQSQFLVELFLHSADISNPLMPPDLSAKWTQALVG